MSVQLTNDAKPSEAQENWRYSRIGELDLDSFQLGKVKTTITQPDSVESMITDSTSVVYRQPVDLFEELNQKNAPIIAVKVGPNRNVATPILITHQIESNGVMAFTRLVIEAQENSEITIVERFISDGNISSLVVPVVEIRAAQSARVTYLSINELGTSTWQIGYQTAVVQRGATVNLYTVALGGDYARIQAEVCLAGQGANSQQIALYFADSTQMHDFRTLQDHSAPRTHSNLLFKGAVKDTAKSVYTGLIRIRENGDKSEAFQTNRNLTLSEGAWAHSVPNLEIETNDVKCSHASTVGPIDGEEKFYLESRGIRPEVAERLVVLGFFDEVLNRLPIVPFIAELRQRVSNKLLGNQSEIK